MFDIHDARLKQLIETGYIAVQKHPTADLYIYNYTHIDFIAKNDSITLRFKSIDIDDAEDLARGIMHILPEIENGNWAWNKFKGITTEMKNN